MRILTAAEMKAAENAAVAHGISYAQLMENAGTAAAREIINLHNHRPGTVLFLCGKGNNAGDAFVIGRLLAQNGWQGQWVSLCGTHLSPLAAQNKNKLPAAIAETSMDAANFNVDFIVDGVFGTGFKGELPANVAAATERANQALACRIALDIPTGLNGDTGKAAPATFCAQHTFAFGALKPALAMKTSAPYCGSVTVLGIGL